VSLDLFPVEVAVATGPTDETSALHPEEELLAQAMGASRQREFAAGRDCARRAMHALGADEGPVLRGTRHAPRFPAGVVGAITHTRGSCAAAVAKATALAGVGIDAEQWKPLSERALARICAPEEIAHLQALPHHGRERWGAVVFSAKETLYKAYFPLTETFIGFRDARIRLHPESRDHGRFEADLTKDDTPSAANRRHFEGRYRLLTTPIPLVVTGLVIPHDTQGT
jgi:4'-phosphopantetheinyl transferase EntD